MRQPYLANYPGVRDTEETIRGNCCCDESLWRQTRLT